MPSPSEAGGGEFRASFPARFEEAISEARLAARALTAGAESPGEAGRLGRIHELYRLRVELEMEVAGVLWKTAETLCAMADAADLLRASRARREPGRAWVAGSGREVVPQRGARAAFEEAARRGRRPEMRTATAPAPERDPRELPEPAFGRRAPGARPPARSPDERRAA